MDDDTDRFAYCYVCLYVFLSLQLLFVRMEYIDNNN